MIRLEMKNYNIIITEKLQNISIIIIINISIIIIIIINS